MLDLDTALESAKRPERTVSLCLRGDLQAKFEELERQLQAVNAASDTSLAGNPEARAVAEQVRSLEEEMAAATYVATLRGLNDPEWHDLVNRHPPRDGNAADRSFGYNHETFFAAMVRKCLVDVSDEQWKKLYAAISSGQFEQLSEAALAVSRRRVDVPKSLAASVALSSSDATSPLPAN